MKIHAIQTGTVAVRSRQPEGVGHGLRRRINTLFDTVWSQPLPIWAFAIEHPEGVIVVDTGETARASEPGYFPGWHPYFRYCIRTLVGPEDEIGPQLALRGIPARDVRTVVMTHLHTDHAGGLHHFPHSEIFVSRVEAKTASGFSGRLNGYLNNHFPGWFDPKVIDLRPIAYGPFLQSLPLTKAGDVVMVPLPGHTLGHVGVVVRESDHRVLIAGDTSYSQELMQRGAVDGVCPDEKAARTTLAQVNRFIREEPTVYLVAHDPETGARLAERRTATQVTHRAGDGIAQLPNGLATS